MSLQPSQSSRALLEAEPRLALFAELAEFALARALAAGADQVEVTISEGRELAVGVRQGALERFEAGTSVDFALTVYVDQRSGHTSSNDLSPASLEECVQRALAIARVSEPDPAAGLPDPQDLARDWPELDLWHPWPLEAEQAIAIARRCEEAGLAAGGICNSEGAALESSEALGIIANSHGLLAPWRRTDHSLSCVLLAGKGERMQRDGHYTAARSPEDLEDAESVGRKAAARALARVGARPTATGRFPVLFDAEVAASLIRHLLQAASGSALYRRASFLVDALGRRLFPEWLSLVERPHLLRGAASAGFDAEGVATREQPLVENGRLVRYLLSSYTARKLGMRTTGNAGGVFNLELIGGQEDRERLMRAMGRGLLVTELMGPGVNLVTGDYSRGAAGFWVEDGAIAFPVEEVTIAGNLLAIFQAVAAAGADLDRRGSIHCGSLLIEQMTVAGRD